MFNKKGISPLIATVLVIGFTIVLAALVIQWGGQLVDKIKGETEVTSELSLTCSTGLTELKITKAEKDPFVNPNVIKVTIDNKNDQVIEDIVFRKYHVDGTVITFDSAKGLAAFGVEPFTVGLVEANPALNIQAEDIDTINEIGVLVKVKVGTDTKICPGLEKKAQV